MDVSQTKNPRIEKGAVVKRLTQVLVTFGIQILLLFSTAGSLDWLWGWVFVALSLILFAANGILLGRRSPELIAERSKGGEMQTWDKIAGGLWGICYFVVLLVVGGLDFRLGWTGQLSIWWHVLGGLGYLAGGALFTWAMLTNAFFSTTVRLQTDRGHTVCKSGPYQYVRHPGYTGAILQGIALPLLLGSFWAFIPGLLAGMMMTVRTAYEDEFLAKELEGYHAFRKTTRFRLFPGLW